MALARAAVRLVVQVAPAGDVLGFPPGAIPGRATRSHVGDEPGLAALPPRDDRRSSQCHLGKYALRQ